VSVDSAQNIGKAHVILHNFVGKRDGFRFEDTFICKGLHKTLFSQKNLASAKHLKIRCKFAFHVLWQYDRVETSISAGVKHRNET